LPAVAPGSAEGARYYVYLFDRETSTVREAPVDITGMVGDQAIVTKGLAPGDIIVVAGVPFLRNGQEVKLMNPSQAAQ
jgi:multidrug efflux pump subunit AcrA (membrane-fusion protein)